MPAWMKQAVAVAAVAVTVFFTNLGGARLWDRDEPRNAGCAREMMVRGDWVTPVFNSELRTHKPVLLYWLMIAAYQLFGISEFSARFWSAVAGVGTALTTYAIGRRLFCGRAGMWAGIAVASNLLLGMAGRAATPDAAVIFLSSLSVALYVLGTFAPRGERSDGPPLLRTPGQLFPTDWRYIVAIYSVMGVATLAKGPVGFVLPTAVIGMFLLLVRLPDSTGEHHAWLDRLRHWLRPLHPKHFLMTCWSMHPIAAVTLILLVAAPWYVWVGLRTDGEFLRGFFFEHNVGRAMQSMEGHSGGFLFYPLSLLVGFFPWSVFALPLLLDLVHRLRSGDPWRLGYLLAICWVGVYIGAFSLARTKLPSYITPCLPGAALLCGAFLHRWTENQVFGSIVWRRAALVVIMAVGAVLSVGLPVVAIQLFSGDAWLGLVGAIPLVAGAVVWMLVERRQMLPAVSVFSAFATGMVVAGFGLVADQVSQHQQNERLLSAIERYGDGVRLASFGMLEPSWVFYGGRSIDEIHASGQPNWLGNWAEVESKWLRKPPLGLEEIAVSKDGWLIITSDTHLPALSRRLPDEYRILARVPYFLKDEQLLLLGRDPDRMSKRPARTSTQ